MARRLGKDTIEVLEPGVQTDHLNAEDDWTEAPAGPVVPLVVKGCYVELSVTAEDLVNRDAKLAAGTVFAPAGTPVSRKARIRTGGVIYDIDGVAFEMHSYSGALDHVPIPIKFWNG